MKGIEEAIVELIVSIIGWFVCMAMASGFFVIGFVTSTWWGRFDPVIGGMLSVASFIWLYEHRIAHERRERLDERLDRLWAKVAGLD